MDSAPTIVGPNEPPVHEVHPELHHYTTWKGLEGIVRTGQLWATRYDWLNDASEVFHFSDYFVEGVALVLKELLIREKRKSLKLRLRLQKLGPLAKIVRQEARAFVEANYQVSFKGGPKGGFAFAVPYIFSFCSHSADQPYERENGLLSQWRSYGGDAGFAIVFDSQKLNAFLQREWNSFSYTFLHFTDAIYDEGPEAFRERFRDLCDKAAQMFWSYIRAADLSKFSFDADFLKKFFLSTSRFKHRGFMEEREVRVVACPTTAAYRKSLSAAEAAEDTRPLKRIHERDGDPAVPYIALFDNAQNERLPITRIIVGPHADQEGWRQRAAELVNDEIPLFCSATPFIDRRVASLRRQAEIADPVIDS